MFRTTCLQHSRDDAAPDPVVPDQPESDWDAPAVEWRMVGASAVAIDTQTVMLYWFWRC